MKPREEHFSGSESKAETSSRSNSLLFAALAIVLPIKPQPINPIFIKVSREDRNKKIVNWNAFKLGGFIRLYAERDGLDIGACRRVTSTISEQVREKERYGNRFP